MRKLILVVVVLILVGCQKEPITLIEDQVETIGETEQNLGDGLWYKGYADDLPLKFQYSIIDERVIGEYILNERADSFSGSLEGDYMILEGGGNRWILYVEGDRVYGALIEPNGVRAVQVTKDNQVHQTLVLSDNKSLMTGIYYEEGMTIHEGSEVRIQALFDHMIYGEILSYNGIYASSFDFIAIQNDGYYECLLEDMDIQITFDRYDLIVDANHYKMDQGLLDFAKHYSESHRPEKINLLDLDIFSGDDLTFYQNLMGEDYALMAANCQIYEKDGDYIKIGLVGNPYLIEIYKEDGFQYIHLSKHLFSDQKSRLYTNDLDTLPVKVLKWQSSDVISRRAMTDHGFEVPLFGDLKDFVGNYSLLASEVGMLDRDTFEDAAMILEGPSERVLVVLKGGKETYRLDVISNRLFNAPDLDEFEDLKIQDHQLWISYYGGETIRQGRTYIFDATKGYLLTQMILKTHEVNSFDVREIQYDLVSDEVRYIQGDSILPYDKINHEEIYLHQFDVKEGIDETYR